MNLKLDEEKKNEALANKQALEKIEADFLTSKTQANRQADVSDMQMDRAEVQTSKDFNQQIGEIALGQEGLGNAYNQQLVGMGRSEGNALAVAAASGIRSGSSLSKSIELESSMNAMQLQNQQDMQNRSDAMRINQAINSLGNAQFGIGLERENADYTRALYEEGGLMFKNYQLSKTQQNEAYLRKLNNLQNMYQGYVNDIESKYNRNLQSVQDGYNDYMAGDQVFKRLATGTFSNGASTYQAISSWNQSGKFMF